MKNTLNGNGLKREIGLFSATILVIANMIGTGIFTTTGFIMAELNHPGALLTCWLFGGIFALCGALCYGELGAKFSRAGGEYVFLRESFGKPMGFLSGWISLIVGFSAPIAAASLAFSQYVFHAAAVTANPKYVVSFFGVPAITFSLMNLTAVGVIILFSLVHYHSLLTGSRVQNGLTIFKTALIVGFILCGFAVGEGSWDNFAAPASFTDFKMEQFAVSLIFISFAYSGWNASAYLGGEIKNPQKNIPLSLLFGTLVVVVLYMLLNMLYIYSMPAGEMNNVLDIGAKSATALFGGHISRYFSGAVGVGILSVLSAMIMTGPRVYYAMAKDGIFFSPFGRVNRERHTPASSIFLQAAIAIILVLTSSFNALLIYIGFTLSIFALMTVAGMMRLRKKYPEAKSPYRTFGYPLTPLLFITGNLWIILFSLKSRPVSSLFGLATIGTGLLMYWYFSRPRDHQSRTKKSPVPVAAWENGE